MLNMKVLIVDDERPARDRLARLLRGVPDIEIAGEAADGIAALEAIPAVRPDAMFLDVQMPGLDGFEVLAEVSPDLRPLVVFVTAYDDYAIQAFDVSAVDYVVKPVEEGRLLRAIQRLRERDSRTEVARLVAHLQRRQPLQRIVGMRLHAVHVLPVDRIEAFVADHELVFAVTPDGRFLVNRTLRDLEGALDAEQFVRVHKQAIVNVARVSVLTRAGAGGASARLQSGETILISRRYARQLRQHLRW